MSEPRADIQPELWVSDGAAAVAYFEQAFGAVVEHRVVGPGDSDVIPQLMIAGARFGFRTRERICTGSAPR
jgi:uncharacterized glyoxalase superfamily protein PhnB